MISGTLWSVLSKDILHVKTPHGNLGFDVEFSHPKFFLILDNKDQIFALLEYPKTCYWVYKNRFLFSFFEFRLFQALT